MEKLSRFYTRLGLAPGAPLEQIKQAYAAAEQGFHAERFSDDPQVRRRAQEQLSSLNEAYLALVDAYKEVQASLAESEQRQVHPPAAKPAPLPEAPSGTTRSSFTTSS